MNMMTVCLPAILEEAGLRLIGPDVIRGAATVIRAQVTSRSTAFSGDGNLTEHVANAPRFTGVARGLLIEGQRTNLVPNPRMEGVVLGNIASGGAAPTNMQIGGSSSGLLTEITGVGTEQGISYFEVRRSGIATVNHFRDAFMPTVTVVNGETYTASFFARMVGGSYADLVQTRMVYGDETGASISLTGAPLSSQRFIRTRTSAINGSGRHELRFSMTVGAAYDFTLRYGLPQFEAGVSASSPILPPVGAPASSTRGADLVSAALGSLGIAGPCTILWSGVLAANAPASADQTLFQLDDGSAQNRVRIRNLAGGATIIGGRVTAAIGSDTASLGSMSAGSMFRAGMTLDAAGRMAACLGGGNVQTITGAPTSGLTTMRMGNDAGGATPMSGEIQQLRVLPFALTDAQLSSAVAGQ